MRTVTRVTATLTALLLLMLATTSLATAQQATTIEVDSPVRGLEIDPTRERVDLDVNLFNRGTERREVQLVLEDVPEGWNVGVWSRFFDFRVTNFIVEPTANDPDRIQQVRIRIMPPEERTAATHTFTLVVQSPDGSVEYDRITYTIRTREAAAGAAGTVSMRADIPVLPGPPGTTLGFEVVVRNDTGEETSFNLAAEVPSGWRVTFREPFGEQRVIGAVSVPNNLTERVRVDLAVPMGTELGEYEIPVTATSAAGTAQVTLRANIVGRGELRATTPNGVLSVDARAGNESVQTLRVMNPGTDTLRDILLRAEVPSGWTATFNVPANTIAELPPDDHQDVEVTIRPAAQAISGDYIVTLRASAGQASAVTDWRVTVTQSTIWGWLGIVLVVLVVGGMVGLFLRLGRR